MQALSSMLMRPIVSHSKHNVFFDINLIDFWLFDNEYKNSGENLQDVLFCNNSKKETSFPTIEEQMSAFPFLSPHKHYSAFIEEHPELSVSPSTVNKSVNEKGGVDFVACLLVCTSIFGNSRIQESAAMEGLSPCQRFYTGLFPDIPPTHVQVLSPPPHSSWI